MAAVSYAAVHTPVCRTPPGPFASVRLSKDAANGRPRYSTGNGVPSISGFNAFETVYLFLSFFIYCGARVVQIAVVQLGEPQGVAHTYSRLGYTQWKCAFEESTRHHLQSRTGP